MSRKKRIRRRIVLWAFVLLAAALPALLRVRLAPYVREVARNQAVNAASEAINGAITRQMQSGSVDYSRTVILEKNVSGEITALRTDMAQVAKLKAEVLAILEGLVDQINTSSIGVPLGTILFPDLFAGKGPVLPVKAISLTTSNADFYTAFTSAGINQTMQTLSMDFSICLTIWTPAGYDYADVSSTIILAQTVIVGSVPQTFLHLGEITAEGWDIHGPETGNPGTYKAAGTP